MSTGPEDLRADGIAQAVRQIPSVRLQESSVVGTHLPGRRVPGVRLLDDGVEVHVAAVWPTPVAEAADAVRSALQPLAPGRVDVVIDDVVLPGEPDVSPQGSTTEDAP